MFTSTEKKDPQTRAAEFLAIQDDFHLGILPTEHPHPLTLHLSDYCKNDPQKAITILKAIDLDALNTIYSKTSELLELSKEIIDTFNKGGRVFIFGCGATGRLAMTLEFLWRATNENPKLQNSVVAFMSGGDSALIKSVEDFEDHPEFGARHIRELGFSEGDLLISSTEGGETPIVIGATEEALNLSSRKPYFLYCNPDDILCERVERSRRVIQNHNINKINLTTGPMAVSGSTRMQASTVLLAAIGASLFASNKTLTVKEELDQIVSIVKRTDFKGLESLIINEADIYAAHKGIIYKAPSEYAMTVLTDTTERSPTFSLTPFENVQDLDAAPSQVYLSIPGTKSSETAWKALLLRTPRSLEWIGYEDRTSLKRLHGFDISENIIQFRMQRSPGLADNSFFINQNSDLLEIGYKQCNVAIPVAGYSLLARNVLLKLLLNTHSTIVMGRLGRFEGNSMTYVKMANNKLIDRAARYTIQILKKDGYPEIPYHEVVHELFEQESMLAPDEPVVIKTVAAFKNRFDFNWSNER